MGVIPAYFNWSSGKDSALALWRCLNANELSIKHLVTTINTDKQRVSMHGLRVSLLKEQAKSIGIPLHIIELPDVPTMSSYETAMELGMKPILESGLKNAVFGDIFLEDLKKYREDQLSKLDIKAHFPLWKEATTELPKELLSAGFKAIVVCVDGSKLDESFVGRLYDETFIMDLPENVDPCGENGEFHTFVYDGPLFQFPVTFELGEKTTIYGEKGRF